MMFLHGGVIVAAGCSGGVVSGDVYGQIGCGGKKNVGTNGTQQH